MPENRTPDPPSSRIGVHGVVSLLLAASLCVLCAVLIVHWAWPYAVRLARDCFVENPGAPWNARPSSQMQPAIRALKDAASLLPEQPERALRRVDEVITQLEDADKTQDFCRASVLWTSKAVQGLSGEKERPPSAQDQAEEEFFMRWKILREHQLSALRKVRGMLAESKAEPQRLIEVKAVLEWEITRGDRLRPDSVSVP